MNSTATPNPRTVPNDHPEVVRAVSARNRRRFPWWAPLPGCWQGLSDAQRAEYERNLRDDS